MKVSVLVPTHRRPRLLRQAIQSIHGQTMHRSQFEVIVANDHTDPLADDILAGLQGRVIEGPFGGCSAGLNAALRHASGEYVTVAADDDLMLPEKLEWLSDALDKAPRRIVATFGLPYYVDAIGKELGCPPRVTAFLMMHPVVTFADVQREGLWVHGTALLYRRSALEAIGGWDETLPTAEEYDLNQRLLRFQGDFQGFDLPVVTYRLGGKHRRYRENGRRPRAIMNRIQEKVA